MIVSRVALAVVLTACAPLTVDEEKQLGREAQRAIRERVQLFRDPVVARYVRGIGDRLARAAGPTPFDFRIYVVEDEQLNAAALPAGAIYVNTGLILVVGDVAQLAAAIAHEMGHVTARHVARLYRRGRNVGVAAGLLSVLVAIVTRSGPAVETGQLGADILATAYMATFTQEAEREADRLAVATLVGAGYEPRGLLDLLETLQREAKGLRLPPFLSSHPTSRERVELVRQEIERHPAPHPLLRADAGALERVQQRIESEIGTDPAIGAACR